MKIFNSLKYATSTFPPMVVWSTNKQSSGLATQKSLKYQSIRQNSEELKMKQTKCNCLKS